MRTYTVEQVAKLLNANAETVRRWIRSGKLRANMSSRKGGNVISEDGLNSFLAATPKYAGFVGVVAALSAVTALGIMSAAAAKGSDAEKVKGDLQEKISQNNASIDSKRQMIERLKAEIDACEEQNKEYFAALDVIKKCEGGN